jgi:glycosyltransferase involved in cell wall biosynthesis
MISICVPVYEMAGQGVKFLARLLNSIAAQSFTDYETIISDHSIGGEIAALCADKPKLRYIRNPNNRGSSSANLNHAINNANGGHIKIILQDDFLAGPEALGRMIEKITGSAWLVHAYWHTDIAGQTRFHPTQPFIPDDHATLLQTNSIGAPTAIMFQKNELRFDENLIWFMDCEFYFRLLQNFGPPVIITDPLAVQTLWPGQLTHKLTADVKQREAEYIQNKYGF